MSKFNHLSPNIFDKIFRKEKQDNDNDYDFDLIFREVNDNATALKAYKLDALAFAFDIIEAESNGKFATEIGQYEKNKEFISICNKSVRTIKGIADKINVVKERDDSHCDDDDCGAFFIDYSDISQHFTHLLDNNMNGDKLVEVREEHVAAMFFDGNKSKIKKLQELCNLCYARVLGPDMETVSFATKNVPSVDIGQLKNTFDNMAERAINQYAKQKSKLIMFPGVDRNTVEKEFNDQ